MATAKTITMTKKEIEDIEPIKLLMMITGGVNTINGFIINRVGLNIPALKNELLDMPFPEENAPTVTQDLDSMLAQNTTPTRNPVDFKKLRKLLLDGTVRNVTEEAEIIGSLSLPIYVNTVPLMVNGTAVPFNTWDYVKISEDELAVGKHMVQKMAADTSGKWFSCYSSVIIHMDRRLIHRLLRDVITVTPQQLTKEGVRGLPKTSVACVTGHETYDVYDTSRPNSVLLSILDSDDTLIKEWLKTDYDTVSEFIYHCMPKIPRVRPEIPEIQVYFTTYAHTLYNSINDIKSGKADIMGDVSEVVDYTNNPIRLRHIGEATKQEPVEEVEQEFVEAKQDVVEIDNDVMEALQMNMAKMSDIIEAQREEIDAMKKELILTNNKILRLSTTTSFTFEGNLDEAAAILRDTGTKARLSSTADGVRQGLSPEDSLEHTGSPLRINYFKCSDKYFNDPILAIVDGGEDDTRFGYYQATHSVDTAYVEDIDVMALVNVRRPTSTFDDYDKLANLYNQYKSGVIPAVLEVDYNRLGEKAKRYVENTSGDFTTFLRIYAENLIDKNPMLDYNVIRLNDTLSESFDHIDIPSDIVFESKVTPVLEQLASVSGTVDEVYVKPLVVVTDNGLYVSRAPSMYVRVKSFPFGRISRLVREYEEASVSAEEITEDVEDVIEEETEYNKEVGYEEIEDEIATASKRRDNVVRPDFGAKPKPTKVVELEVLGNKKEAEPAVNTGVDDIGDDHNEKNIHNVETVSRTEFRASFHSVPIVYEEIGKRISSCKKMDIMDIRLKPNPTMRDLFLAVKVKNDSSTTKFTTNNSQYALMKLAENGYSKTAIQLAKYAFLDMKSPDTRFTWDRDLLPSIFNNSECPTDIVSNNYGLECDEMKAKIPAFKHITDSRIDNPIRMGYADMARFSNSELYNLFVPHTMGKTKYQREQLKEQNTLICQFFMLKRSSYVESLKVNDVVDLYNLFMDMRLGE
jgi:hypothetical protein